MRRDHEKALRLFEHDMKARNLVATHVAHMVAQVGAFLLATPKTLRKIRRVDVESYLASLFEGERSADFQFRSYVALKSFFGLLVREERLAQAPSDGLLLRKPERDVPLLLSPEAVGKLLAASSVEPENRARRTPALSRALALRDRACVELLYGLGLRLSEACRATLTDLRLKEGEILVRRSKRGKVGVLPLPPASVPHLERYVLEARPVLVGSRDHGGRVLLTRLGTPLSQCVVARLVSQAAARAGLLRAHPHALRRAVATHLVKAGVSVPAVQDWLGHNSMESTARYLEVDQDDLRRAVEVLDETE